MSRFFFKVCRFYGKLCVFGGTLAKNTGIFRQSVWDWRDSIGICSLRSHIPGTLPVGPLQLRKARAEALFFSLPWSTRKPAFGDPGKLKNRTTFVVRPFFVAESEGFEPPDPLRSTVFKTAAFDHSANSPKYVPLKRDCKGRNKIQTCKLFLLF